MKKKNIKYVPYVEGRKLSEQIKRVFSYSSDKNLLVFLFRRVKDEMLAYIAYWFPMNEVRVLCNRWRGVKVGKNIQIGLHCILETSYPETITIEDDAGISGDIYLLTHSIPPVSFKGRFPAYISPIVIKKGAWIGIRATILPGVTIGENSVVSAGSVVSKDVPDNAIVRGNPAEVILRMNPQHE